MQIEAIKCKVRPVGHLNNAYHVTRTNFKSFLLPHKAINPKTDKSQGIRLPLPANPIQVRDPHPLPAIIYGPKREKKFSQ